MTDRPNDAMTDADPASPEAHPTPRGRGRPRAEPADAQRARILAAARVVFARDGLAGARIDEIAERAGINKAALYRQFSSKEELFDAVVDDALTVMRRQLVDAFRAAPASTPRATLRLRIDAMFRFVAEEPDRFEVIEAAGRTTRAGERVRAARRRLADELAQVTRDRFAALGLPTEQAADMVAAMTFAIPTAMAARLRLEPGWDRDAVVDLITEFTVGGLRHVLTDARDVYERADVPTSGTGAPDRR